MTGKAQTIEFDSIARLAAVAFTAAALWAGVSINDVATSEQLSQTQADSAVYRVDASSLRWTFENGERVIYLEGGVRIEHQTTIITSSRGKHFPSSRHVMLIDSVRVVDGTAEMTSDAGDYYGENAIIVLTGKVRVKDELWRAQCDRATYDRNTKIAVMTGNLSLADSTRTLYADTVIYDRTTDVADARGKVVLVDDVEDYSISGSRARYDRRNKTAYVDERPVLTFDMHSDERGAVTSKLMKFDVEKRIGIADGDVSIAKGKMRANCDSAAIYDREGRVELFGKPQATNGDVTMMGARMAFWYSGETVEKVLLPEKGRISQAAGADSPWREDSWIEGDSIEIFLSKSKVDSLRISRGARAMYYPVEKNERKVSNNFASGERMFFYFRDERLSYLRIDGRSSGLYKFMNLEKTETIDSLAAAIDTTLSFRNFASECEDVKYSADTIEYFADRESIVMLGRAVLLYQDSKLEARRIDYNSRLNLIEATGSPVLEEEGQPMYGNDMGYDLDTGAGVVVGGSTKYGEGYYLGNNIFKVGKNVLKVYRSTYTTCDLAQPHYSLRANKMKVYINDKIVSGPIVLRVGEVPIFYLPFMVNTLRRTRSSGFLRPNFDIGIDSREGRFIRGLGYYWATNDYTDFTLVSDFNEEKNVRFKIMNRYKVRYLLDGDVRFDFVREFDPERIEWQFESNHAQQFSRTASFRSRLQFVSSGEAQRAIDRSEDTQRLIDRKIYSTASFRKSWGGTSLSLSASRDQKLNVQSPLTTSTSMTLPSFSLNFPRTSLWFGEKHSGKGRGIWERTLSSIMFSPNLSGALNRIESGVQNRSVFNANSGASFSQQHRIGFLDLGPSVGLRWNYVKEIENSVDTAGTGISFVPAREPYRNELSMNLAAGLGTKIYGTFYPRIGGLVGIRHTINPTISWQYTPKLTERQRTSQSVSWSIRNSIDLKLRKGETETKENGVLTWYLGGVYYPDSLLSNAFGNVTSSARLQVGSLVTFNLDQIYDVREHEIVSTTFSTGFGIRGSFRYPAQWEAEKRDLIPAAAAEQASTAYKGEGISYSEKAAGNWSFRLNYHLSQHSYRSSAAQGARQTDSNLDIAASISLTKNWNLNSYGYYDIEERDFKEYRYEIERDLHCWRASFNYRRLGTYWSYYFQIAIKAHPDIMYERGTRGIQSFGPASRIFEGSY